MYLLFQSVSQYPVARHVPMPASALPKMHVGVELLQGVSFVHEG